MHSSAVSFCMELQDTSSQFKLIEADLDIYIYIYNRDLTCNFDMAGCVLRCRIYLVLKFHVPNFWLHGPSKFSKAWFLFTFGLFMVGFFNPPGPTLGLYYPNTGESNGKENGK